MMKKVMPKRRFKGFTDDWEQRKLGDVVSYFSSNLTSNSAKKFGNYDLYDANEIIGKTNRAPIKMPYISIIKDGAGVGRIRILPKNTFFIGTMGALIPDKSDLNFIFSLLTRFDLGRDFTGSTIPHIYFSDYKNNAYFIPEIKEQLVIGKIFNRIDQSITLHQRKAECVRKLKFSILIFLIECDITDKEQDHD